MATAVENRMSAEHVSWRWLDRIGLFLRWEGKGPDIMGATLEADENCANFAAASQTIAGEVNARRLTWFKHGFGRYRVWEFAPMIPRKNRSRHICRSP